LNERPTYLEALRLRERIIAETDPEQLKKIDSIVSEEVGKQDAEAGSDGNDRRADGKRRTPRGVQEE